jgi:RNA polymerase sigma factor (sigma-70 family)
LSKSGVEVGDEGYNFSVRTVSLPAGRVPMRSKRLLSARGDDYLVAQIRRGEEAAFEVALERHGPAILSFCRHMLGSPEEAEDALQQTFASAYRDLLRDERPITLKPWLFTIARNRCLSMLRARREQPAEIQEIPTVGLAEQVERRADLRELLEDLHDLPEEQRAALLLAEAGDLSHAEVAGVLEVEVPQVKALVFRARSGLIGRRDARHAPCEEIREQLANLRGGSLRRSDLRHHLRVCAGCREYREQVRSQRQMLAAVLPVAPSLGLKSSVLAAIGIGGGGAGGAGLLPVGGAAVAKLCVAGAILGGSAVGGEALVASPERTPTPESPAAAVVSPEPERAEAAPAPAQGREERAGSAKRAAARRKRAERRKQQRARHKERTRGTRGGEQAKAKPPKARPKAPSGQGGSGSRPLKLPEDLTGRPSPAMPAPETKTGGQMVP